MVSTLIAPIHDPREPKLQPMLVTLRYESLIQYWTTNYVDKLSVEELAEIEKNGLQCRIELRHAAEVWQEIQRRRQSLEAQFLK